MTIEKAENNRPAEDAPDVRGAGQSPIEFRLESTSGVPTYLQLVQQVEHALRLGYLRPGDQLPRIRDVVELLAINPNTVLKAYRDLEHKGLAAGRPGQGTFVQGTLEQVTLPDLARLRRSLLTWLAAARSAGLDEAGVVALVTTALQETRVPALDAAPGDDVGSHRRIRRSAGMPLRRNAAGGVE